jgi:NTE family protein
MTRSPDPGTRPSRTRAVAARPGAVPRTATQPRRRIAIACQGGGSQTAFTAGALRGLLRAGLREDFDIVGLSGTSGGSICAALLWVALLEGDPQPWTRLEAFWRDNAAVTPAELAFNDRVVATLRMTNAGVLPSVSISPSSPLVKALFQWSTIGLRPLFTDFAGLLRKHIDFARLAALGPRPDLPALVVGAVDVLSGRLAKFCTRHEPLRTEHLLASCAVPSLFPAVEFDGAAYWDGLFSDNPPINELAQSRYVGIDRLPHEIWVIKINPTGCARVPASADDISDRRNELIGNMSMFQQLDALAVMNDLYLRGAFKPDFVAAVGLDGPVRIPRSDAGDGQRPYHIPFIEMSQALAASLDYESKLDRSLKHIEVLMDDGEQQARRFLDERAAIVARADAAAAP